jgi:hypothetical protein
MADPQLAGIFSKVQNQGKLIDVYSPPSMNLRLILLTGVGLLGLILGGVTAGIYLSDLTGRYGPAIYQKVLFIPLVCLFLWVMIFTICGMILLTRSRQSVGLFEHGIAIRDHQKIIPIRWEGIYSISADVRKDVFLFIPLNYTSSFTLRTWNNQIYDLNRGIKRLPELAENIEDAIAPLLLEKMDLALEEKHLIPFGSMQVNQEGVVIQKQQINYADICAYQVKNGKLELVIDQGGKKNARRIPAASIQNLHILIHLLNRYVVPRT